MDHELSVSPPDYDALLSVRASRALRYEGVPCIARLDEIDLRWLGVAGATKREIEGLAASHGVVIGSRLGGVSCPGA